MLADLPRRVAVLDPDQQSRLLTTLATYGPDRPLSDGHPAEDTFD